MRRGSREKEAVALTHHYTLERGKKACTCGAHKRYRTRRRRALSQVVARHRAKLQPGERLGHEEKIYR